MTATIPRVRVLRSFCLGVGKYAEVGAEIDDLPRWLYATLLAGGAIEPVPNAPPEQPALPEQPKQPDQAAQPDPDPKSQKPAGVERR